MSNPSDNLSLKRFLATPLQAAQPADEVLGRIERIGSKRFEELVQAQGLTQHWRRYLEQLKLPQSITAVVDRARDKARLTAANQLLQRKALDEIRNALEHEGLDWFIFKGADLRNWLYPDPTWRAVSDIDIHIQKNDAARIIQLFTTLGYEPSVDAATASHEITLSRKSLSIDLHWHPFRPGRAREGLVDWLFEHREVREGIPGLDATASLLIMLVHPAITKYLNSPASILVHLDDQARLIECNSVDWGELVLALETYGLKAAAWSSLLLLESLTGRQAPGEFVEQIAPGRMRQAYLRQWIRKGWVFRWWDRRWIVAGFFSLALQDNFNDAVRALNTLRRAKASDSPLGDFS